VSGECPASKAVIHNGINGGKNAGRHCWMVSGTVCDGYVQGEVASKLQHCVLCDFFKLVKKEEGERFKA